MSEHNDGGPAFPRPARAVVVEQGEQGMTVRAYISTEAMAALIVANSRCHGPALDADAITDAAVEYADGLIEALNGKPLTLPLFPTSTKAPAQTCRWPRWPRTCAGCRVTATARTAVTAPAGAGGTARRGTALADKLDAEWTGDDVSKGRHLSNKYRKQLAARPPLVELVPDDWQEEAAEPARYGRWFNDGDKPDGNGGPCQAKADHGVTRSDSGSPGGGRVDARLAARHRHAVADTAGTAAADRGDYRV